MTALSLGCNGRSSEPAAATPAATQPESSGSEHAFPHPHSYAHKLDDPERDDWQKPEQVIELLDCRPGMVVADIGAGTGYFLPYLSPAVGYEGKVLALDTERSMVEAMYARVEREELRNVRPDTVLASDPALTPRSVDRILIVNTWHHIDDRIAYAKKLLEALRPGGRLLIVDFTAESPHGPPAQMRVTDDTVRRELQAAGFRADSLEETLPYQYALVGTLP